MTEDLFDKYGLEVQNANLKDVKVGERYPIYGMVTDILGQTDNSVKVEVNFNMAVNMMVGSPDKIDTIKERSFEPGIFIVKVLAVSDDIDIKHSIEGDCQTVIFGKRQKFNG